MIYETVWVSSMLVKCKFQLSLVLLTLCVSLYWDRN